MSKNYLKILMKRADIVRNWKNAVKKVAKAISDVLPDAEMYVFGSAVKRRITASSDIDLLIFSEKIPEKNIAKMKIILEIENKAKLPEYHPFEFHLVNKRKKNQYLTKYKEIIPINVLLKESTEK